MAETDKQPEEEFIRLHAGYPLLVVLSRYHDAVDQIERLQRELAHATYLVERSNASIRARDEEIERLKSELRAATGERASSPL